MAVYWHSRVYSGNVCLFHDIMAELKDQLIELNKCEFDENNNTFYYSLAH